MVDGDLQKCLRDNKSEMVTVPKSSNRLDESCFANTPELRSVVFAMGVNLSMLEWTASMDLLSGGF